MSGWPGVHALEAMLWVLLAMGTALIVPMACLAIQGLDTLWAMLWSGGSR